MVRLFCVMKGKKEMYDVTIIGAGVVGGMIARALSAYKLKICILEKENDVVYSCLGLLPQNIEVIVEKTGMTAAEVFHNLVQLMMVGLVIEPTKNHYSRAK